MRRLRMERPNPAEKLKGRRPGKGFAARRDGKGTREWADRSYNICLGCRHGCLYCYARSMAARLRPGLGSPERWPVQVLNPKRSDLGAKVPACGVVMFPTSHDLVPEILPQALDTIRNLLERNQVLLVSKAHLAVVRGICREFAPRRDDLLFRLTIGSLERERCAFWEPVAPAPAERLAALRRAYERGFHTSVSCEPMLSGPEETLKLVKTIEAFVTDTIWIGKMQRIPCRLNTHVPGFAGARDRIRALQTDASILELVAALAGHPRIRWKDSIRAVIARHPAPNGQSGQPPTQSV